MMNVPQHDLFHLSTLKTRWFTLENPHGLAGAATKGNDGRKRSASVRLAPGGRLDLVTLDGQSGTIRRIWITVYGFLRPAESVVFLRGLRIVATYDGAATPAIDAPLGDFFCQGLARLEPLENALFASPEGRSLLCTIPMPFRTGVRLALFNDLSVPCGGLYYEVDATLGDEHATDAGYLHACWRRQRPTRLMQDFEFLPRVVGRGRLLGTCFSVLPDTKRYGSTWWGEGEVKIAIDGDTTHPTLCGTGTEDYIGTGWGQGRFIQAQQGCPVARGPAAGFAYAFYRLHLSDPIYFQREICGTIQQIGGYVDRDNVMPFLRQGHEIFLKGGEPLFNRPESEVPSHGHIEREDDWGSLCWFYLDRPENDLGPCAGLTERLAGVVPEPLLQPWQVLGPVPATILDEGPALAPDALPPEGHAGRTWVSATPDAHGLVDLGALLGVHEWHTAFAQTVIESSQERDTFLALTSDDAVRVWLNGKEVHSHTKSRPCSPQLPDWVPVRLKSGTNLLVFKILNHHEGWGFGAGLLRYA